MRRDVELNGFRFLIELKDGKGKVSHESGEFSVEIVDRKGEEMILNVDGERFVVRIIDDFTAYVNGRFISYTYIERPPLKRVDGRGELRKETFVKNAIVSPISGRVNEVLVKKGSKVKKGDTIVVLESMKMLIEVKSEIDGVVEEILVKRGDVVSKGQVLVKLAESEK